MKRPLIRLNPVTLKRLRRFRKIRRAWWSLWILVVSFALSLFAELICGDSPLYVRHKGASYFPIFKYHPDDVFTGSGKQTRPDYMKIHKSAEFRANPSNRMIFPLIPYGPEKPIEPTDIEIPNEVTVHISKMARTATVNLDPEYAIVRSQEAAWFFGGEEDSLGGRNFRDTWRTDGDLAEALRLRFANERAPRFEKNLARKDEGAPDAIVVSLPEYEPRARASASVRLTLREIVESGGRRHRKVFDENAEVLRGTAPMWDAATEEERDRVRELVKTRFREPVIFQTLPLGGENFHLSFEKEDVRFPFRPIYWSHPFGLDESGRDVLARIIHGYRLSMSFGLLLVMAAMVIGLVVGSVQGYFAGMVDLAGQRVIEIWSALPFLYVMILLGSTFGRGFGLLLVVYGIFNWIGLSYYIRAEFLRLRKQQFVEAARCIGVPTWKILFKHIFPNSLAPIITLLPFSLVGAIGSLSALDYLGFGVPPPTPSWGELLSQAQTYRWAWWLILYPSLSLFIVMLLGVFVGEGLRNAFDPRDHSEVA
jgi:microcin C transport system permease protein